MGVRLRTFIALSFAFIIIAFSSSFFHLFLELFNLSFHLLDFLPERHEFVLFFG